jgi:hypothetical protein
MSGWEGPRTSQLVVQMPTHANKTARRLSQDTETRARSRDTERRCAGQTHREDIALSSAVLHRSLEAICKRSACLLSHCACSIAQRMLGIRINFTVQPVALLSSKAPVMCKLPIADSRMRCCKSFTQDKTSQVDRLDTVIPFEALSFYGLLACILKVYCRLA